MYCAAQECPRVRQDRYRNDSESYDTLVELLKIARYHGDVSMTCIDDATRPQFTYHGFTTVSHFIQPQSL